MKPVIRRRWRWAVGAGAAVGAAAWLAVGCAAPSSSGAAPRPGRGLIEYQDLTREAHRRVTDVVNALAALPSPIPASSNTPPAAIGQSLARLDRAQHKLELASMRTRARAEAILARGQAYFDEWSGQLAGVADPAAARAGREHHARLLAHFERIRDLSGRVRSEFQAFMKDLREFRARLDRIDRPGASAVEPAGLLAAGRRVLQSLDAITTALGAAEIDVQAGRADRVLQETKP